MKRCVRSILLAVPLASLCLIGLVRSLAQESPREGAPQAATTFVLRVNPEWADRVNAVLKRVAHPSDIALPAGMTPGDLVQRLCAGHAVDSPAPVENEPGKIRLSPCVNIATGVKVTVQRGNTLEGIAVRNGLPASAGPSLKVTRPNATHAMIPGALQPGDVVSIPEVPLWTTVAVRDELIKDRKSMVDAIAAAVNCKGDQNECILKRGIYVLEGAGVKHEPRMPPPNIRPEPLVELKRDFGLEVLELGRTRPADNVLSMAAPPPTLPAPKPSIAVATDQWPYDVNLLAAIFQNMHAPLPYGGTVGVADLGLADGNGGPLPNDLFDHSEDQRPDYDRDVIGAGVKRSVNDIVASGDVSLCGGSAKPPFSAWDPDPFKFASHASVTVSLAGALRVRQHYPAVGQLLPRVVFFRMLPNVCDPTSSFDPGEGAMAPAFTYLAQRSDVIAISFMSTSSALTPFVSLMQANLVYGEQLLILPSGDDIPGDLDKHPFSPQLLGSNALGVQTANRTIVVGTATRELAKAGYSNYGDGTVSLYAPGEPVGALNILGQDASAFEPATSYSAPYVALAAGILRSFGYTKARDIKDRLAAATWPITDVQSSRIGVVDLVKVAAVQFHAVEVIEPGPQGLPVRRTYVGKIQEHLQDLAICKGWPLFEGRVHAVRLDGDGPDRTARVYLKNDYEVTGGPLSGRRKIQEISGCRSQGELHINALLAGQKTFPLSSVTQIQLPWVPVR